MPKLPAAGEFPRSEDVDPNEEPLKDPEAASPAQKALNDTALSAVSPHKLLEGEDPTTSVADDALAWVRIYSELIGFKRSVIDRNQQTAKTLSGPSAGEIAGSDLPILNAELARFEARLDFWRQRLAELGGLSVDLGTRTARFAGKEEHLTVRECQLLGALLEHQHQPLPPARLIAVAWRDGHLSQEQLRLYIVRLRRILVKLGAPHRIVSRRRPGGYVLVAGGPAAPPGGPG